MGYAGVYSSFNDPGTAFDVVGRSVRLLAIWAEPKKAAAAKFPNVYVPAIATGDVFGDLFAPIARDGTGNVEVGLPEKGVTRFGKTDAVRFGPARDATQKKR